MVIDSSALIAILLGEPEADAFAAAISSDNTRMLSTFSFLEASIVIEARKGEPLLFKGDDFSKTDISFVSY